ncbi:MAG: RidA family protein, partial [Planctomycetota bacterium]
MTAKIDIRTIESSGVTEVYISAAPRKKAASDEVARQLFSGIKDVLKSRNARILEERIFATASVMDMLADVRAKTYAGEDFDDGVAPSYLVGDEGNLGPIAGVQLHAISGDIQTEIVDIDENPRGRILRTRNHKVVTLSGISVPELDCPKKQARTCLEKAEAALKKSGTDFLSVARTWMWLGDILAWYDDFNGVRNRFFTERGIIGNGTRQLMPASTGIGLGPADKGELSMDLFAVVEPSESIEFLQAGGKQKSAFEYGSAFSRASKTPTPGGDTVFVSGTASIDKAGATTNIGDAEGQIKDT